ncbi:hypothetical protein HHA02_22350 [Cobetia marina]|nr:hypothetical protein HHA02_22350 [Cobetia marina]
MATCRGSSAQAWDNNEKPGNSTKPIWRCWAWGETSESTGMGVSRGPSREGGENLPPYCAMPLALVPGPDWHDAQDEAATYDDATPKGGVVIAQRAAVSWQRLLP